MKILSQCLLLSLTLTLTAQEKAVLTGKEENDSAWPGVESEWHGLKRYDFNVENRNARVIVPAKPAEGNPWVWRARFPDYHYQMDSILAVRGFHIAYINTDGMFGSPDAITIWDGFYNYLTEEQGLNRKVALEGVSRGGLFIFRFAKTWPGRVSCIYAECPVCDFKSWPGGKGIGDGDPESWKELLKAYRFENEKEAVAYNDNPVDNLENLAAAKVPLWFSISLNDTIVPPEENTYVLANRYMRLGGPVTVYPNTRGRQSLKGHHFEIDDVEAGVEFIIGSYGIGRHPDISDKDVQGMGSRK